MKKTSELNINDYIMLGEEKVGYIGNLEFQTFGKRSTPAGKFEILAFEQAKDPHFTYSFWMHERDDTPNGADIGYFYIRLYDTKYYNGKVFKFRTSAYVQDRNGLIDHLFISTVNEETGKELKAYSFPILNL